MAVVCATGAFVELRLTSEMAEVGRARRWARDRMAHRAASVVDDVELIVSELVTNSLRAGGTTVRLELQRADAGVRIGVSDDAPGRPVRRAAGEQDTNGRGLPIVAALTRAWGVLDTAHGKETWAVLSLPD